MQKYFFLLFLVFVINGSDVAGPADDHVGKRLTIKLNSGTELTTDEFVPFSQSLECAPYEPEFCFSINGSYKIKVANGSQVVDYDEILSKIYQERKPVFVIPFPLTKISTPISRVGSVDDCPLVALGLDGKIYSRDEAPEGSKKGMLLGAVKEVVFDAQKGEERQTFTVKVKVNAELLAYDKAALEKLAFEKVSVNIPTDRELIQFNKDALIVRIRNVNKETGEVQLSVYGDALVRLSDVSPILDPIKIAGMLPDEAARYLQSFDAIEEAEVKLFPSWQKRIPTIPDRIKIVIKK